jgi:hypothetical protein
VKERFAMEESTLYNGATLAKCELLARLRNNHIIPNFVPRTDAEVRANIAACIDAIRVPWERGNAHRLDIASGDDDDELQAAAPRPKHRTRTPSLTKALREAKKAGISVTGATFTADSVSLSFGEAAKSNGNDLDQWLAGRHENPTKGH